MSDMRKTDSMNLIKDAVHKQGEAFDVFTGSWKKRQEKIEQDNLGLLDRIEELESRRTSPGKTVNGIKENGAHVFHTPQGKVFQLPHDIKVVDVLPAQKQPEVSLQRWLSAYAAGEMCGDKEALEYFRESKALSTTTSGMVIPEEYVSQWIDLIRSQQVLITAGMTTLVMQDKIQNSSAVTVDPTASWHTEAGSISATDPTFSARTLTAQTLVTRCQASVEVTQDSPDFGAQLAAIMTKAMAVELDRVGMVGSGAAPQPQGILGTTGINQVTSVGTITDYAELLSGIRKLLDSNIPADIAAKSAIMSPGVWLAYENLVTGISSDKTKLMRPKALENTNFLVTSNGLDTGSPLTSTIFLGDFRDLVLGIRAEAFIESLKLTTFASNLQIEFVGYLRADYLIRRPLSFCTLEGVTPSA